MKKIAIIGGGVSGIASAFYLENRDIQIDLYEAQSQLGGRVGQQQMGERWIDMGGKNIGRHYVHFREFLSQLGNFDFEYFGLNTGQQVGNRIVTINKDKGVAYNACQIAQRIGLRGLYHLFYFAYRLKKDRSQGFLNTPFFNEVSRHYDQHPLSHYFSAKTLDFLIRPLTVRMNGAEPEECYMGNFGSNLNLLLDSYEQVKGGMHQCLDAFMNFSRKINIHTNHAVQSLTRTDKKIRLQMAQKTDDYDHVVIALPAQRAAALLTSISDKTSDLLNKIHYHPVAVAVVDYDGNIFTPATRALVFNRTLPLSNAGAYGVNELNLVRYTFSGKAARKAFDGNASEIQLIEQAEHHMSSHFNMSGKKRKQYVYRHFNDGLCAYSSFHHQLLQDIQVSLPEQITLTGDYRKGASIEACFQAAYEQTEKIL